ncbi:hypothetical protein [Flavobacterium sp. ZB4P13]|uniref:hypothetical protein n=1 Tax=Flavobacterium sp. ZB4P13 TaxID=3401728 RepID=UPI003AAE303F
MVVILFFLFLLVGILYWKRKIFLLSPVDIFVLFFVGVLISTVLYHNFYPKYEKFNFFQFDFIGKKKFDRTFFVYLKMLLLFLIGVFLYSIFNKSYFILAKQRIKIIDARNLKLDTNQISKIIVAIALLCVVLVYIDYGSLLFYRVEYIPKDNSIFKIIYQNLFIVLCLLSGTVYRKNRSLALAAFLIAIIVGIGVGSRSATIYLLAFGLSYSVFLNRSRAKAFYIFFIPFVIIFFGYNISLRLEANGHGLIPYLKVTLYKPEILFKYTIMNIYYTFIFGFYATSETIHLYKNASINNLVTTLNPLPGRMTNWYSIASKLRINEIAPFTAIGELAKYPIFSIFYYSLLGYYFAAVDYFIKNQLLNKKYFWAVLQFLLLVLYVVHSFEYNLRSSHRFIYYSMAIYVLYFIFKGLKTKLPRKSSPTNLLKQ